MTLRKFNVTMHMLFVGLAYLFVFLCILLLLLTQIPNKLPYDSTDNAKTSTRSGFTLYTDYGTGCEYLKIGFSLTPRLDSNGKIICNKS